MLYKFKEWENFLKDTTEGSDVSINIAAAREGRTGLAEKNVKPRFRNE